MGFGAARRTVANPSGPDASLGSPQRRSLAPGEAARRFGRGEVLDGSPPEPRMYPSIDGAGVPMRGEEAAGVAGRQADGTSRTGEARPAAIYTAGGRDPETTAASGSAEPPAFAARLDRGVRRRGPHGAGGPVAVSEGAGWIPNACDGILGGRRVTFAPGLPHRLECAADAVKAVLPAGAERGRRLAEVRADIMAGRAARAVRGSEPSGARYGEVAARVRHFRGNMGRMRYDGFRGRSAPAPAGPGGAPTPCPRPGAAS